MSESAGDDANPWSCVAPTHIPGKGEALVAARDIPPNRRILRVAPFAAVPYGRFLDTVCSGCLQPCDTSPRCSRCAVARHCALCASSFTGRAHEYECHALARLARNERGLTLAHDDLRLLLRVLSRRRDAADGDAGDDDEKDDDEAVCSTLENPNGEEARPPHDERERPSRPPPIEAVEDPFLAAAAEASDVVADAFSSLDALMSGFDGDDDGALPEEALRVIGEVAKQCKFLVAASCRTSEETYARLLGKLQLNGFEITAADAAAAKRKRRSSRRLEADDDDDTLKRREKKNSHPPVGVGVYPSAARFNHSCEPNCAQSFDAFACVVVETTRAVVKGEELTIPYVDVALDAAARNQRLERNFAFRCACARCRRETSSAKH